MFNEIIITRDLIFNKVQNMDEFYKNCLYALYKENQTKIKVKEYIIKDIIKDDEKNALIALSDCVGAVGIYFFTDADGFPQYIGKGGTSKNNNINQNRFDLKDRIGQELREFTGNPSNTLSKNIIRIDGLLENKVISGKDSIEKIKGFNLTVLIIGKQLDESSKINSELIKKTEDLEVLLLSLFPTKYNF